MVVKPKRGRYYVSSRKLSKNRSRPDVTDKEFEAMFDDLKNIKF